HKGKLTNVNPPRITTEPFSSFRLCLPVRRITTVSGSGLYDSLQWTVQSATVDCTVHCRRL
ncbi:hypothetical protein PQG97_00625, partial [Phocaeicola massiliensis]|uniref:hypothetical protein n=1 Tax=Phocaeicola massiliensis TaxID=204516 RepID=UPI00234D5A93